ncbi:hypothetical protein C2869_02555 [Saccharobesus litoralis]|uniref:Uncharacterized protein n=1 Tax=Saccharobesus litoralis TaxID=2172099 RepID=A0A2S0VME8_9ALTE|nr:hypothetical protein [Saccharobesus litoralis]AWB65388.1 hypothetical protein C2869_02555 [Saccharobesus litoralis]
MFKAQINTAMPKPVGSLILYSIGCLLLLTCAGYYFYQQMTIAAQDLSIKQATIVNNQATKANNLSITNLSNKPTSVSQSSVPSTQKALPISTSTQSTSSAISPAMSPEENWLVALKQSLTIEQENSLHAMSVEQPAELLSQNQQLQYKLLNKLLELNISEQRAFLMRVVAAASPETRRMFTQDLLASSRAIDRNAGVTLLMQEPVLSEKKFSTQILLQNESDPSVLTQVLLFLNQAQQQPLTELLVDELASHVQFNDSAKIRGLALQTLMKINPSDPQVTLQAINLISSSHFEDHKVGLNVLTQQLNDYGIELKTEQRQSVHEQLTYIINDTSQTANNKNQAQMAIDLLNKHN